MSLTKEYLRAFEDEIALIYGQGKISAPVHLRSGCEEPLINIFSEIRSEDFIFSYWASHLHCLLKGVPRERVKQSILEGKSISLCYPDFNIFSSGIVGSLAGVATGTAMGLKLQKKSGRVFLFTGDMGAECGIFHEALKYAYNHKLPMKFIVEDNGVSVMTKTREVWNSTAPWFIGTPYEEYVIYYQYENEWPHSGLKQRIAF
jgi:TPP-dependent pyruvate/acetoin dehydrogenase alpha subunit